VLEYVAQRGCDISVLGGFQEPAAATCLRADLDLSMRLDWRCPEVPSYLKYPLLLTCSSFKHLSKIITLSLTSDRRKKKLWKVV